MTEDRKKDVLRETDAEAIRLAKTLLRTSRHGALAVIHSASGAPMASRVAMATDLDGAPLILVSSFSAHTPALLADPRCSLLVGEPGKGDPLAHPRMSIACGARRLERGTPEHERAHRRYLARNPKARLYIDFPDFSIFRLEPSDAGLNGGFARAYRLSRDDLMTHSAASEGLAASEAGAVEHMNADHRDAIDLYAAHYGGSRKTGWRICGIDADGIDLVRGGESLRVFFDPPLAEAGDMRPRLVAMARAARDAGGAV
jgi:heme iron utilization protein